MAETSSGGRQPSPGAQPLISVVTPVYNGEKYLSECIESVRAQSYPNWEHVIVNNCSRDRTLAIAQEHARADSRIRIHDNVSFLDVIQNHNQAFRQMSAHSRYCKPLEADDWLYPHCLEELARVAEAYPQVGIVGSYVLYDTRVACDGLPYPSTVVPGREVCRWNLLRDVYTFLSPSALLIRAEFVRAPEAFYHEAHLHADVESCYEVLAKSDFGFVHQVLSFVRRHGESVTSAHAEKFNTVSLANLEMLLQHGPTFLDPDEYRDRLRRQRNAYYSSLARSLWLSNERKRIWSDHSLRLKQLGQPLSAAALVAAFVRDSLTKALRG